MGPSSLVPVFDLAETSVPLLALSLSGIAAGDAFEVEKLVEACKTDGGFYLDLDGVSDRESGIRYHPPFSMAEEIFHVASEVFAMPLQEKLRWEMDQWGDLQIGGYKPAGKHSGVCRGKRDGFENFLVPLNAIFDINPNPNPRHPQWPSPLSLRLNLFKEFETSCQRIALLLLSTLSNVLIPPPNIPFQHLHREGQPSTTSLAILRYLPSASRASDQVGHMAHTDVGSLTLIFASSAGLQVFRPSTSSWVSVPPRPGSIFVNVGDSLRFMSEKRLTSCLHRVVPNTGLSGAVAERYSLAFFQRPELSASFVDSDGHEWISEDWHRAKYKIFRADNNEQTSTSLLTGKKGFLGEWQG